MNWTTAAVLASAAIALADQAPVAAQPSPSATTRSLDSRRELNAEIERIASASQGVVGVAAVNLRTGASVEYNGEVRFGLASTFKLPVAVFAFRRAEQGAISLTEALPVPREDMIEPGILNEHFRHPGFAMSTLNAIELSITQSDNGATDVIYNRVGGPAAVNEWLRTSGFGDIYLGRQNVRETFAGPDPLPSQSEPRTTTPHAMIRFLSDLHAGRLIGQQSMATLSDIMSRVAGDRISLQLPPGTTVLHKTGTLFGGDGISVNDVGFIRTPYGDTIAIAVYIKQSPQSVTHATRDRVIGAISRSIYDYFLFGEREPEPARDRSRRR